LFTIDFNSFEPHNFNHSKTGKTNQNGGQRKIHNDMGGKLLLCSPCLKERNISKDDLIDGSEIIAAGTVISEVMSAKSVLTY
jgi:predicted peroxiredoxin